MGNIKFMCRTCTNIFFVVCERKQYFYVIPLRTRPPALCHVRSVPVRTTSATSGHVPSTNEVLEGTVGLHLVAAEPFYVSVDGTREDPVKTMCKWPFLGTTIELIVARKIPTREVGPVTIVEPWFMVRYVMEDAG